MDRFIDNGDGTITDTQTDLMWTKDANLTKTRMTWKEALEDTKNLTFGGFSDWRIPTIKELLSLVDYSTCHPALPIEHPFIDVQSSFYWSSTTGAYYPNHACIVNMWNGVGDLNKSYYYYVWPVRSIKRMELA